MSISRRKFLRAGALVALAAAVPVSILGQNRKEKDGNPFDQQSPPDPLSAYNKAAFASYVNSIFRVYTGYSVVEVALTRVSDMPAGGPAAPAGSECFSLLFVGGNKAFGQGTYKLDHPSLGSFQLFLVPTGADDNGAESYLATINRLGYSPALINAPTRLPKTTSGTPTKPETVTPVPATKPETVTPAPVDKPTQKTRTPHKVRPSWKRDGNDEDSEGVLIDY